MHKALLLADKVNEQIREESDRSTPCKQKLVSKDIREWMKGTHKPPAKYDPQSRTQLRFDLATIQWIARDNQPFSAVEGKGFIK